METHSILVQEKIIYLKFSPKITEKKYANYMLNDSDNICINLLDVKDNNLKNYKIINKDNSQYVILPSFLTKDKDRNKLIDSYFLILFSKKNFLEIKLVFKN